MKLNDNINIISPPSVTVKKRVQEYTAKNPSSVLTFLNQSVMNMPLPENIIGIMKDTIDEVANPYGMTLTSPWDGYDFLKKQILTNYNKCGVYCIGADDIVIAGGLETALASVSDLFSDENNIIIQDPCEVCLRDMQRITGRQIRFMKALPENSFKPMPDADTNQSIIFLSNPNSITGASYTREELLQWVNFANETESIIVYNSSLSHYFEDQSEYPRTIYEIPEANLCAIEIFSFTEGFGVPELKVAYTVIPRAIVRNSFVLSSLYHLRQHSNSTPPSYILQRTAEQLLSDENQKETEVIIHRIKKVGAILAEKLKDAGIPSVGNLTSPFIWAQCPKGMSSWKFFDTLLEKAGIVVIPGSLFGSGGEGFFRLTSFGLPDEAKEAAEKIVGIFAEKPKAGEQKIAESIID